MYILAIETSCDETACAVVENGNKKIVTVVASSKDFHEKTGGIVPEVAARKQVEYMMPVLEQLIDEFKVYLVNHSMLKSDLAKEVDPKFIIEEYVDAIAVTVGPGLAGSLIVGIETAKTISFAMNKPLIPVNHLIGHIYGNYVDNDKSIELPAVALVVSGGHTDLILMKDHYHFEYIGGTLDDAAGEAFDKTARILGISNYLGGALLSNKAKECTQNIYKNRLPRPMLDQDNYDFSFSGLKTAVKRFVETEKDLNIPCTAKEFEEAVVDVLVGKTMRAVKEFNVKTLLVGGGVSANNLLRQRMQYENDRLGISVNFPPFELCTDNAVYIASTAYYLQKSVSIDKFKNPDYSLILPIPSLQIMDTAITL